MLYFLDLSNYIATLLKGNNLTKTNITFEMKFLRFEYKLSLIYIFVGLSYILFSDALFEMLITDIHTLNQVQTIKGSGFILATGLLLFILLRKYIKKKEIYEQEIIESKEKYITLYNYAPLAYQSLNMHGEILDINPKWLEVLGYERNEVIGKNIKNFMANNEEAVIDQLFSEMTEKGHVSGIVWRMRKKDGGIIYTRYEGNLGYDTDGSTKQTFCTFTDITVEHLAKIELLESENRYKSLFYENKSVMLLINPSNGKIVDANNSALEYYGYTHEEITKLFVHSINTLTEKEVEQELERSAKNQKNHYHFKHILKNGGTRSVEVYSGKVVLNNEELIYSIIHDISKQVEAEAELILAKEKAEESDRLKSAFLANLSHEIRTPMNGIIGFTDLLRNPDLNSENKNKFIDIVHSSSNYLLSIINDIVEISHLETNQIEVNETAFDVDELMAEIKGAMYFNIPKNIEFIYEEPEEKLGTKLVADRVKVKQVIINLLNNSIKNTSIGQIKFGYEWESNNITIFVEDTGRGIEKINHDIIFDRFRQLTDENDTRLNGSGLGLSISKSYVEMMGGNIWVESEINKGAKFMFNLPLKSQPWDGEVLFSTNSINDGKTTKNILIAEDDDANYEYLKIVLKKAGKNVMRANNGFEAIEMCKFNPSIDFVLMDIKMPQLDGIEAVKQIKEIRPDLIIVAQTAYALKNDEIKIMASGFDGYLSKPIRKEKLLKLI